jgi:glycosyltransferase involved in cell wall biosynthesis
LNILHVISSADPRGGGPIEGIHQRGLALLAMGHQVELLTMDAPGAEFLSDFPLPVHAVGPGWGGFSWAPALKTWLRAHARRYDAVVISGLWQYHGWATSRVLRAMGLPYFVFTHGMLDPWFRENYPFKHLKKWAYWQLAERHVLRHAEAVLFTSEEERLRARLSFTNYVAKERVVDYGTNPPPPNGEALRLAFRQAHPHLADKRLLLFLGRIHEKKGCDLLVQAFGQVAAEHPDLHLVMAGPAHAGIEARLQKQANALGAGGRVTWLGMVTGEAKWQALYGCDAFVLPSHQENFGIAVAEALGCGLPALVSDKVNTWREMVGAGAAFVAPDTAVGTTELLRAWLRCTAEQCRAMAVQAKATFTARYTAAGAARSLLSELQQSVQTGGRKGAGLKILHVVTSVDPQMGGIAESIRSRGVKLMEMGHGVEVVSLDEPKAAFVADYPLPLHALGPGLTRWAWKPELVRWLNRNVVRFDAVVVDGLWQYHGLAARQAGLKAGVPYFVFPHGMLDPWFKKTYPLKHLKKWLVWPWADYRVLRDAAAVLFTCEEELRLAPQSFALFKAKSRVVPFGTTTPPAENENVKANFCRRFPALEGKPYLLFLGRVHPKKGCDLLIEALLSVPDATLAIAGPGEAIYIEKLKQRARDLKVDQRVHWLGMLTKGDKWAAMYGSDAFVLPSHQENFGVAVAEALACRKPVLISDKVNIWREIDAGHAGLVFADTVQDTAKALQCWLAMRSEDKLSMREAAAETYQLHFTVTAMAQGMLTAIAGGDLAPANSV